MADTKIKNIIKGLKRYRDFTFFEEDVSFKEYFKDKIYDIVQIHDTNECGDKDIIGFCGAFSWCNGIHSLDGDSYNENMHILGYHEFFIETERGETLRCLDVLTEDW